MKDILDSTMKHRVLIFSLAYYPHVGGAEVALKEITNRISDIEFHLITLNFGKDAKEEKIGNVFVHRIGNGTSRLSKFLFQFFATSKASQLHRQYRFDGTWAMMAHSSGVPAGVFKTFHPEVKYLLTLQEGDPPEYIERLMRPVWPLFKRGFTKADAVVAESTFLGRWARRMGFKGPLEVIPNGVNAERFSQTYAKDTLDGLSRALGKREGEVYLITTSRLVTKNACDEVIRALPLMPDNITFLVLGIGPDEAMLRALAKEMDVEDRVKFLGFIGHGELPKYLALADIYIRPSRSEGMGNSFIEAMAAELPVIATQEGGIADFLFDPNRNSTRTRAISNGAGAKLFPNEGNGDVPDPDFKTGWAVDKNSPEQIAEAVKDILAHPEQVARVKATAKKMAIEKYDWNLIAKQMQALFDQLFDDARKQKILEITDQFIERYRGALEKLAKH